MAKGWKSISVLLILAMLLALGVFVLPATAGAPTSNSGDGPPGDRTQEDIGNTKVLLIQDIAPWGTNSNHAALAEFGVSYDVINSQTLANHQLNRYCFIMFASYQPTSFYRNIAANMAQIDAYVKHGGLLIAHCADSKGSWLGFSILPGGVTHVNTFPQIINIMDPSHGVVTGLGAFTLTDAYLHGWFWSAHGYFTNLARRTKVVMQCPDGPTYIDYQRGEGKVLATMQTVEWAYSKPWVNRPELLRNEIRFGIHWCAQEGVSVAEPGVSPTPPAPARPLNPADMSSVHLSVNPQQTYAGQPVTILTNVVNTGDEGGNYSLALKINGQVEQTRMVSVGPQGTQPVKFTVTKDQPGTYTVNIDGKEANFTILGAGGTAGTPMNGGLMVTLGIVTLIIAAAVVLVFILRRPA